MTPLFPRLAVLCIQCEAVISPEDILHIFGSLEKNKGHEPECVPNRIMKECSGILYTFLYVFYNRSLSSGRFPSEWKWANIVPLHKSVPKDSVINYRPITLACESSKIMGHIICTSIVNHSNDENAFAYSQHGFKRKRSRDTQLVELYHDIASSCDQANQIDCVFMNI